MRLSLCLATYNEEKFIHYPLDSCIDWVDEVVIMDGGSSDKTVEIAKSYGKKVRVLHGDNPSMFHINKQKAISAAKGEWILQLDADEAVSKELKEEILSIVGSRTENFSGDKTGPVAYWIPRKNYFLGRFLTKGGVYPDKTIRLYKNGVAHFPCKTVHENVEIRSTSGVDQPVGTIKNDLLHYADPDFDRYLKRWRRYNNLDAQLLKNAGKKPCSICYLVGKPLMTFVSMYILHKGFMDSWQGLVFSFYSSIRYIDIYFRFKRLF